MHLFMKNNLLPLLLCVAFAGARAQTTPPELLTADAAVGIALQQNFDIRLIRADAEIARLNNTKGNAGMLPNVNLVVNETFTLSAFQQKLANGNEFTSPGAPFNAANAGVQLNWTIFDGRRMQIAKKRLEETEALGQIQLRAQVLQTSAAVLTAYYQIVGNLLQEKALAEVIALNEERLRIAEARLAAGFAAQTDALQARIDLNQRRADLLNQQNATQRAKQQLNLLLARPANVEFRVEETINSAYQPQRDELLARVAAQHPDLQAFQKTAEIAALLVDETRTQYKPRIVGNAQLIAQRTDNGAGFLLNNTQAGLTAGGSFILPLYTGGNISRQIETAKIAAQQAAVRTEALQRNLENALDQQLAQFQTQQKSLELESGNTESARESLRVSTERFRLGQTTALEVQNAQNVLEQVLLRRNLAQLNLKIAEIQLRILENNL
jgi:outer membrane protein TolC